SLPVDLFPPRQYFVLTEAGKPVFVRCAFGTDDSPELTATMGIMQALISIFADDNDKLRCINCGKLRITFLLRPPLYYVCASSWGEPESITRSHLEYLHLQILSVVSLAQLRRIFERRNNFDLRRLLDGAENLLHSLLARVDEDFAMTMSALHVLKVDDRLRKRAGESLQPPSKLKRDILYIIVIANGRVVTVARPKKHSIHPSDLHILLNTLHSPSILNSSASASWLPVCLPKFNPSGFANVYVSRQRGDFETGTGVALVCVSAGGDFEAIRGWCDLIAKKLTDDNVVAGISKSIQTGTVRYSVAELSIPGLRHFVYKSRLHVQVTVPMYEDPYDVVENRRRLVTLYQAVHDNIHAKSGQKGQLKLQYLLTEKESIMGWITQPFELYIAMSPLVPKSAVINAANAVARWVKREEGKLFLRNAPVF
ncbi:DUF254-domain-containing protein, partial [Punctularia strigosozonata HHB-11173 SS5]|uniref:DUF254-domain-containing protein n=1 Tax=Punctularia strigosozonata (strain HHB-11173) TaxID=741275 RepID=UPI000441873A